MIPPDMVYRPRPSQIILDVCNCRLVKVSDVLSRKRTARVVRCRWEIIRRLRYELKLSLPQIGRIIHRDHTTVLHALQTMADRGNGPKINLEHCDVDCMLICEKRDAVAVTIGDYVTTRGGVERIRMIWLPREEVQLTMRYDVSPWLRTRNGVAYRSATVRMPKWIAQEKGMLDADDQEKLAAAL
jgi:hypothetical protein